MKHWAPLLVLCVAAAAPAFPQPYDISWRTVDAGGSMGLSGGPYRLDVTIGQPDAGPAVSGGPYELAGGFWPVALPNVPTADLSLTKTDSPDPVIGLQPLTYTLAVANAGPAVATDVIVTDTLPASVVFQSAGGSGWSCGEAAGVVTCTRPSLPVGAAPNITITVTAPPTAQTLVNTASVDGAESDPVSANNSDTETTTVTAAPTADLSVIKSDGGVTVTWGQPLTYTIVVANSGPAAVAGAIVADAFPTGLANVTWTCTPSAGSSCPASGTGNINHAVSLLAAGTATFTATGTVVIGTYAPIVNTATVGVPAGVFDPTLANNTSTETTPVVTPDLIFRDGFASRDFTPWSAAVGKGLRVMRRAAYWVPFGLQVELSEAAPQYLQDDSPVAEPRYRARFYGLLTTLRMGEGEEFELFTAYAPTGTPRLRLLLRGSAGQKRLRVVAVQDDGSVVQTPIAEAVLLPNGWRGLEIDWQASSAPGANDGRVDLWVDGQAQPPLAGIDNDEARIATARWGAVAGLDAGTSGAFLLDEFESRRHSQIGPLSSFADVPTTHELWPWIQALYNAGVTAGCGEGRYCPDSIVTRGQMAVFLLKWTKDGGYAACPDGGDRSCSDRVVTRGELAGFVLAAKEGTSYAPPPCTTAPFLDVPPASPSCPWIQGLAARGIADGCGSGNYCPNTTVTRGEIAVFLARTFRLPVPTP